MGVVDGVVVVVGLVVSVVVVVGDVVALVVHKDDVVTRAVVEVENATVVRGEVVVAVAVAVVVAVAEVGPFVIVVIAATTADMFGHLRHHLLLLDNSCHHQPLLAVTVAECHVPQLCCRQQ